MVVECTLVMHVHVHTHIGIRVHVHVHTLYMVCQFMLLSKCRTPIRSKKKIAPFATERRDEFLVHL